MRICLPRIPVLVLVSLMMPATAIADDGSDGWGHGRSLRGPIFDITHFDVIPLTSDSADFLQTAYGALFAYRDASRADRGLQSFRVVNWLLALNHSQIIDVWSGLEAFEFALEAGHQFRRRRGTGALEIQKHEIDVVLQHERLDVADELQPSTRQRILLRVALLLRQL